MSTEALLIDRVGAHVLRVKLNRPEKRNCVNGDIAQGIGRAIEQSNSDPEIRVVVLCAAGEQSFCSGADLSLLAARRERELLTPTGGFAGIVEAERLKPWIAGVDAPALGGGLEICLSCDMVIASERARFGLPEVKRGIFAGAAGIFRLARRIPMNVAYEMLASGEPITPERGFALGLVNRVVPAGQAEEAALQLAQLIAQNAPLAVQASLKVARQAQDLDEPALFVAMREAGAKLMQTEDAKEGPRAFLEKRPPVWRAL